MNDIVAEEVKVLMIRRGLTQTAVAYHLGISQGQLSKRLKSDILFDVGELQMLALLLDVEVADLVNGTAGNRKPPPGGPDGGEMADANGFVRHQGLEPRTRWFLGARVASGKRCRIAQVVPVALPEAA